MNLVCEGCIPTIASNDVELGVKQFADFDAGKMMEKLATLHNANNEDNHTVNSAANEARQGQMVADMRGSEIKSVMTSLETISDGKDKVLNINSLMTALEDYVEQAKTSSVGVPINYFIKTITKSHLAKMWMKKYSPRGLAFSGDDTDDAANSKPGATPPPASNPPPATPPTPKPPTPKPPAEKPTDPPAEGK